MGFFGFFLALHLLFVGISSFNCLFTETEYTVSQERIQLAEQRAADLIPALRSEVQAYLKHERSTFADLSPQNAQLLLIKYPELRSVGAVKTLLDEITRARNLAYDAQQSRLTMRATLLFHQRWPFTPWSPAL